MNNESIELSKYRLQKAREDLDNAAINLDNDFVKGSINRSYYAIFHAIRAILALDLFDSKKHSGIIAFFQKNYVSTGKFEVDYSKIVRNAFSIRNKSDYDDFYIVSRSEAEQQLANAKAFLQKVTGYLQEAWGQLGDDE
ncbi:MAG: HEPN domain-containing protein [Desulfitobacterium hafniense]|nr:HEPN domain-containing protein [Desulfitobacterium hafniense]